MNCPVAEIVHFLRMAGDEVRIVARVSCVRAGRRIARGDGCGHCRVADRARPSAISNRLQLAVPSGFWEPHLDLYLRIGNWSQSHRDTAKTRQALERLGASS